MKFKTTAKEVRAYNEAIRFSYCAIQHLMAGREPNAYTCGVYGWNADVYIFGSFALVTGYRPFGRDPRLSYEEIRGFDKRAEALLHDRARSYEERMDAVEKLRNEFLLAV